MSSTLIWAIAVVVAILLALVVLDCVVMSLKKRRMMPTGKLGQYFSRNLLKFNAFVILFIFCAVWLVPLIVGVLGSFTSQYTFENAPGQLIPPDGFTFQNYIDLFTKIDMSTGEAYPIARWVLNSFIVATACTLFGLLIGGLAAYAFVFLRFKFRNVLFAFLLFTMVIPGVATMTPQLANISNLGMARSLWALILPSLGGVGGLYLIRQFFLGIPKELIESARMDGMSDFSIFRKIVLPLGKSVFLVQGLFTFMGSWNDLLWPQIILGTADKSLWTLQVGIAYISSSKTANTIGLGLASAIISAIPMFILYIITQNKIVEGVSGTGIKA